MRSAYQDAAVRVLPTAPAVRIAWLLPVALLVVAVVWTIAAIVPLGAAARFLSFTLLCAVPGVVLVRRLYRFATQSWLFALLLGPAWGYALTSVSLLGLWLFGVRRPIWFVLAAVATAVVCGVMPALPSTIRVPTLGRKDLTAVCLTLLLVPTIVGLPYHKVGERLPEGEAWRAYFTADFVWAMAVTSEVSKGDVLPKNPYRIGTALHYYWLAHLVPSIEHRAMSGRTSVKQLLLANAVLAGLAFVGFFYLFVRHFVDSAAAAALGCVTVVAFHSYEGIQQLVALWRLGAPLSLVQFVNIDAVSRWIFESMPVDGLQRLLFYQPQHQLGYIMGVSALLLLVQARDAARLAVMAWAGLLLALSLLLSTFSAMMIATVAALFQGLRMLRDRQIAWMLPYAAVALLPIAGAIFLGSALQYVEQGGPLVTVVYNKIAWRNAWLAIPLSFGTVLILAIAGGLLAWRRKALAPFAAIGAFVAVCWFYYFMVDVRDHQHVYVGWRAGHLLFIAFAPLVAYALQEWLRTRGRTRVLATVVIALLMAAAAPTVAIDLYNTQDTSNRQLAPGFRWTLILSPDELEALDWVRNHTPPDAIVQVDPKVRDSETWAYIPAFGERRMAAGLPISMIPLAKYERATDKVLEIFRAPSAEAAYLTAHAMSVDYVLIAPLERKAHPYFEAMVESGPEYWSTAFRNRSVVIYKRAGAR
jgi:hypothetical protein